MKPNALVWIPARVVYNGLDGVGVIAGRTERNIKSDPPQVLLTNSDQGVSPPDDEHLERVDWFPDARASRLEYLEDVETAHHLMCEEISTQLNHTLRGKVGAYSPKEGCELLMQLFFKLGLANKSDIEKDATKYLSV